MKLYERIATLLASIDRCRKSGNNEWFNRHSSSLRALLEHLPSGSGFDAGTQLDLNRSTPNKLVFTTSFHHMTEDGYYDGWTDHTVTIRPSFIGGFTITVSGRNRNNIKDYIADMFQHALTEEVSK